VSILAFTRAAAMGAGGGGVVSILAFTRAAAMGAGGAGRAEAP
jgi:hypothetical protein